MSRRWNYSLRTLLLVIAAVGVAIGYYVTSRQLRLANQELRTLREETGRLSIEDASRVHAIAVEVDEPNTWRWRLFIPKGHKYSWNIACENIPQHTVPKKPGVSSISNESYEETDNEVLVTAKLRRVNDEEWRLSVESRIGDAKNQMGGAELTIRHSKLRWMTQVPSTDGQAIGHRGTQVHDPKGPIILLQRRPCELQPDGTYRPSPNPMPGFMIWLEKI